MALAEEDDDVSPRRGPGRRCDLGCESWPDELIYQRCPTCGEKTTRYTNLYPVSDEEGRSAIRHEAFERFYEAHCRAQGISVDGPLETTITAKELEEACSSAS